MNTLPVQIRNRIPDPANGFNYIQPRNNYPAANPVANITKIESAFMPALVQASGELFQPEGPDNNDELEPRGDLPLTSEYGNNVDFRQMLCIRNALRGLQYT